VPLLAPIVGITLTIVGHLVQRIQDHCKRHSSHTASPPIVKLAAVLSCLLVTLTVAEFPTRIRRALGISKDLPNQNTTARTKGTTPSPRAPSIIAVTRRLTQLMCSIAFKTSFYYTNPSTIIGSTPEHNMRVPSWTGFMRRGLPHSRG
jgi:hypothetical protein